MTLPIALSVLCYTYLKQGEWDMKFKYMKDPLIVTLLVSAATGMAGIAVGWYDFENDFTTSVFSHNANAARQLAAVALSLVAVTTLLSAMRQNYAFALLSILLGSFTTLLTLNTQFSAHATRDTFFANTQIGYWMTIVGGIVVVLGGFVMLLAGAPYSKNSEKS